MAKKKSNRKRNSKVTVSSVVDNIRKGLQIGGRGIDPTKEFEDAGIPRELPPTATPMPTPEPTVNLPQM